MIERQLQTPTFLSEWPKFVRLVPNGAIMSVSLGPVRGSDQSLTRRHDGRSRVDAGGTCEAYRVACAGSAGYKCGSAPMRVGAIPRDGRWPQPQKDPAEDVNAQPLR
jgi:hypothetical protein